MNQIDSRGLSSGQPHTFRVEGMDCASCAATITKAVGQLPGVFDLKVSIGRETMSLMLDERQTPVDRLEAVVKKLGFRPKILSAPASAAAEETAGGCGCGHDHGHSHGHDHSHDHAGHSHAGHELRDTPAIAQKAGELAYRVEGMDCASCAATITSAIGKMPGVSGINISVARERMTLTLDESTTPRDTLEGAIRKLGFRPRLQLEAATATVTQIRPVESVASLEPAKSNSSGLWGQSKVRHAAMGLLLIALSFAVGHFYPDYGRYAFMATTLVTLFPIARRAFVALRFGVPFTIQMLLTLAALGALFIDEGEEAAIVVLFFSIGEVLEGLAAARARSGIKALGSLIPRVATVEENGHLRDIAAESLQIGQTILCRPGERIPADGVVISGSSSVDESPMTGESIPVPKEPDSRVFAGSINHDAPLRVRVDRSANDNTIARIIALVEEAQDSKAPTERFIDSFSRIYMPAIVLIATLVAVVPPLVGLGDWETWIYRALALLLIGCPCALVISVPAAIAASLATGTKRGMLIKGGAVIEALAKAQVVAFDKTGTLTQGKPQVTEVIAASGDGQALLTVANAMERESSHPLAEAICRHASEKGVGQRVAANVRNVAGRGMEGIVDGRSVFIGAPRFIDSYGKLSAAQSEAIQRLEGEGNTIAVVIVDGEALGLIAMRDEPRSDALEGVRALTELGIECVMLTGDNKATGNAIGKKLGVTVHAELLPEDKVQQVAKMTASRTVVMVGDGINDAPALAMANVGIAIGSGTDVAMEAADAALMRNKITDIAGMVRLSRATMRNIRQNVLIALGLKVIFLVTTVTGISGLWIAVFADTGATVLVTLNAMRLLRFKDDAKS
ncbi:cadmium-translocating P-type ATPase [Rhizobium sp. CG5]|uniref:heavy metal translocating P-type ATPase n=1 Tax=Rhizobium sp. CG5 TaxID=2726076 RepID=UPI0020339F82|nr:heavy metal translocating P-type ATPase [Rhizobium sp. CG5]MCM2477298.1 cadmium-translocating P-type ATPase [Rhizobium sp. CG5]